MFCFSEQFKTKMFCALISDWMYEVSTRHSYSTVLYDAKFSGFY